MADNLHWKVAGGVQLNGFGLPWVHIYECVGVFLASGALQVVLRWLNKYTAITITVHQFKRPNSRGASLKAETCKPGFTSDLDTT